MALILGLMRANSDGWTSPLIIGLFTTAAAALLAFVVIEHHRSDPMLDLSLFTKPGFSSNAFVAFAVQATLIAALTYLSLYVQNTLGFSALETGIRILPFSVVTVAVAAAAARLLGRVSTRLLLAGAAGFAGAGLADMAHLNATSTWTTLIGGLVLSGIGLGLSSTVTNQVAVDAVPKERAGMASGATNALKQLGVAVGVAGLGAVFIPRTIAATTRQLAGAHLSATATHGIAATVAGGAGQLVLPAVPMAARPLVAHAVAAGTTSGLNSVLLTGAIGAGAAAIVGLALTPRLRERNHSLEAAPSA